MSLLSLPDEVIRKIITTIDYKYSFLIATQVNTYIYNLRLQELLLPWNIECLFDIDSNESKKERLKIHESHNLMLYNLCKRRGIPISLFVAYEYIETLSIIIGDKTKYDFVFFNINEKDRKIDSLIKSKWKIFGFLNISHFRESIAEDKCFNTLKGSFLKNDYSIKYINQILRSKTLKAIL